MYVKELKPTHFLTSLQEKDGENGPYRPSLLENKVFAGASRDLAVMLFHDADYIKITYFFNVFWLHLFNRLQDKLCNLSTLSYYTYIWEEITILKPIE